MFKIKPEGFSEYPRQFWLMFVGMILATTGSTMIWPFLMIYASEKLSLPLAIVASLMTISATAGLLSSIIAGPLLDWLGRKWVMVVGLIGNGLCYFILSRADSYGSFALILGASGVFSPLYNVGTNAMLADLFPTRQREDAFALLRMGRNIGVAAGPAIGGFVLSQSYNIGLYGAAAGMLLYGLLLLAFARETLPKVDKKEGFVLKQQVRGYWEALMDRPFMGLVGSFTLIQMTGALIWVLLSVYLKSQFGITEQRYGWLPTTNALMVVFLQVFITRGLKRFSAYKVMVWGAVFYIFAPLMITFSNKFWGFWLAMVVMTLGELVIAPRASAAVANLAPIDKRGCYMSVFGLTWNVASGISPVLGGFLSDLISPRAPWMAGVIFGIAACAAFWMLNHRHPQAEKASV